MKFATMVTQFPPTDAIQHVKMKLVGFVPAGRIRIHVPLALRFAAMEFASVRVIRSSAMTAIPLMEMGARSRASSSLVGIAHHAAFRPRQLCACIPLYAEIDLCRVTMKHAMMAMF